MLSVLQAILNQVASINGKMVTSGQFNSGIDRIIEAINGLKPKKLKLIRTEQIQQTLQGVMELLLMMKKKLLSVLYIM
jgi:CMP-2-keto-3-deoxyoctulosonic acid synthetase